jgi:hypothetical protein
VGGGYKCFFPLFFLVGGQKIQKKSEPGLGVEYFFFNYPMIYVNFFKEKKMERKKGLETIDYNNH